MRWRTAGIRADVGMLVAAGPDQHGLHSELHRAGHDLKVDFDHRVSMAIAMTAYVGFWRRHAKVGDPPSEVAVHDARYDDEPVPQVGGRPVVVIAEGLPEDVRDVLGRVEVDAIEVDQWLVEVCPRAAPHHCPRAVVTK